MNVERKKDFLIHAAYYAVIVIILLLFMRYLFPPLSPFIFGILVAWGLQRPAKALARKLHLPKRIPALLLTIVFYCILFIAVIVAGVQIISALEHFVPQIPGMYKNALVPFISQNVTKLELWLIDVDPTIVGIIDRISREMFAYLEKLISSVSVSAVRLVSGVVTGLPTVILSVILTVISTFFVAQDYDRITEFMWSRLPKNSRSTISQTVTTGLSSIRKVLGSYILILIMSFMELSIGFLLLNVPYAVGVALIVAIIDILPILGTGLVLIPWAIIAAILGKVRMAVGFALGAASGNSATTIMAALGLAIGISIQNFAEGAALSLPLKAVTGSSHKAFLLGSLSGLVEPIFAVIGYFLAAHIQALQPWLLAFAAGAMIFVVVEDLIPDAQTDEHSHLGTWSAMIGFVVMMLMDMVL